LFIIHCFYCCECVVERSCSNLQDGQSMDCVCPKLWSNAKCCYFAPLNWNITRWTCKIMLCRSIDVPKHIRKLWFRMCETQLQMYLLSYFSCNKKMKYVFCIFSYCCTMLLNCWHKFCIFQRSIINDFMVLVE
jgi:hypothetical protein